MNFIVIGGLVLASQNKEDTKKDGLVIQNEIKANQTQTHTHGRTQTKHLFATISLLSLFVEFNRFALISIFRLIFRIKFKTCAFCLVICSDHSEYQQI